MSSWFTAAFCDPNVAGHTPQPYEATPVAFARIALPFGFFAPFAFLALLPFAPFFAGALAFGSFAAFGWLARGAGSVPWTLGGGEFHDRPNHYFALVSFEKAFDDIKRLPRCWVFPSSALFPFVKVASGKHKTKYVPRKAILEQAAEFEDAWHLLA